MRRRIWRMRRTEGNSRTGQSAGQRPGHGSSGEPGPDSLSRRWLDDCGWRRLSLGSLMTQFLMVYTEYGQDRLIDFVQENVLAENFQPPNSLHPPPAVRQQVDGRHRKC